jgi:hypothetical protein
MRLLRLLTVSLIILLILSIYGCGGSTSTSTGTTPIAAASPTPTAVASPTTASAPTSTTGPTTGPTTGLTSIPTTGPTITPTVVPTSGPTSVPTATPTAIPTPGITPTQSNGLIVDSTLPKLKIETDIPPMQINQEVIIQVSIYPTGAPMSISDMKPVEKATPVITNATPVGTPGSSLVNAFGPNHEVYAFATLGTSPNIFSVSPTGPQAKPLDQDKVTWDWFVTPLVAGDQRIGVDIEVQWTSTQNNKQSLPYRLGFPVFSVIVQPLSTTTTTQTSPPDYSSAIATVVAAIIGGIAVIIASLIAIPGFRKWIVARLPEREKRPPTN